MERIHRGTPYWDQYYHEHKARYDFAAPYIVGQRVLDVACGTGYGTDLMRQAGAAHVTGVDLSEAALEEARRLYAHPDVAFHQADATRVGALERLGAPFDVAVSFETIEHVPDAEAFLAAVHRVLKPGGVFLCSSPNREFNHGHRVENPFHEEEMDYATFRSRFEAHFDLAAAFHQSPAPAYRRSLALARAITENARVLEHSRLLRIENRLRGWLGREPLRPARFTTDFFHTQPGDYPVLPLTAPPGPAHLTFLFVGTRR